MSKPLHPKLYGTVTVGERGQIVIPMKLRKQFRLNANDKLVVFARDRGMISLVPAEEFSRFLADISVVRRELEAGRK
ncbi:MAG: AbrB/MazE/SpoVT family DNA-binding domain-containing protein [Candidatus Omnitrophota bacterium]